MTESQLPPPSAGLWIGADGSLCPAVQPDAAASDSVGQCGGLMRLTRLFLFDGRRGCLHEQLCIPPEPVAQRREFAVAEHRAAFTLHRWPEDNRCSATSG